MGLDTKIILFKDDKVGNEPLGIKLTIKCLDAMVENLKEEASKQIINSSNMMKDTRMIFINRGVLLCGESAESNEYTAKALELLKEIEKFGVEILCCGTCIEALNVKLLVGSATSAKNIMKYLLNSKNAVSL